MSYPNALKRELVRQKNNFALSALTILLGGLPGPLAQAITSRAFSA